MRSTAGAVRALEDRQVTPKFPTNFGAASLRFPGTEVGWSEGDSQRLQMNTARRRIY